MPEEDQGALSQEDVNAAVATAGPESEAGSGDAETRGADVGTAPLPEVTEAAAAEVETAVSQPVVPLEIPELKPGQGAPSAAEGIELLRDVELNVRIELGRSRMLVEDVLRLGAGSVVELDRLAGDPVDVLVNNRLVARGEVLVLDGNFCVRISDIISHEPDENGWQ